MDHGKKMFEKTILYDYSLLFEDNTKIELSPYDSVHLNYMRIETMETVVWVKHPVSGEAVKIDLAAKKAEGNIAGKADLLQN